MVMKCCYSEPWLYHCKL